jgi:hypothetical protein
MLAYERVYLLAQLDRSVLRVARSRGNVAAQERRIDDAKQRGEDSARSENLLKTFRDCLRLLQEHHDKLLLELER